MKRVIALAALLMAAGAAFVAPSASAEGVCLHLDVNVNGTAQVVDQCLPPA